MPSHFFSPKDPRTIVLRISVSFFFCVGLSLLSTTLALAANPTVTTVSPSSGSTNGGTPVTITGTGFVGTLYRRPITVTNGNADTLTNYQTTSTINTATLISSSKMQADCADIRMLDSDASSTLSYWIEDGTCNTATTTIWTKIPSLPNGGKTIYLTYGDAARPNTSNGTNVFLFFDDFSGTTLNSQWTTTSGTPSVSGGKLTLPNYSGMIAGNYAIPHSTVWESRADVVATERSGAPLRGAASIANGFVGSTCESAPCMSIVWVLNDVIRYDLGTANIQMTTYTTGFKRFAITYRPGNSDQASYLYDGGNPYTTVDLTPPASGTLYPLLYSYIGPSSAQWDWWLVRQNATSTPQTSVGSESTLSIAVKFGSVAATSVSVSTSTSLTATTPANSAGAIAVTINNPDNTATTSSNAYTYVTPAVTVTESAGATAVTEGGTTDSYTIALTTAPTSTVQIVLTPSAQLTLSTSTLTFTSSTYTTAQTVTVTAADDANVEGTHTGTITHAASSATVDYPSNLSISSITATITDNDTASTGGGSSGSGFALQAPKDPLAVLINNGAISTLSRFVTLLLTAGSDVGSMALSNLADFQGASQVAYTSSTPWDLCSLTLFCGPGEKTVYAKFYTNTWAKTPSTVLSDSILYMLTATSTSSTVPIIPPPPTPSSTPPVVFPSPPTLSPLIVPPASSPPISPLVQPSPFTRILRSGMRGEDVRVLQKFLNTHGFPVALRGVGSKGRETTYYGLATTAAVRRFQEAHRSIILTPQGFRRGTGIFGDATRGVIEKMLGRGL